MEKREYSRVGETILHTALENGLHIYVSKRNDFSKQYAFFAVNYGGMDMSFELDGTMRNTPAGVAHFLEHKMFDTEDGNALQDLSANGASPNAFTSTAMTAYHFESTRGFEENLRSLLSFVSVPYFTKESVQKEQGIIGQEIRMIEDNPDWRLYMNMLAGLYECHPIRVPIAGSVESIAEITDRVLYDCHRAFYHPENMTLCVCGDIDAARVAEIASEILPKHSLINTKAMRGEAESPRAHAARMELALEVASPLFQMGFKLPTVEKGEERLRQDLLGELVCDAVFGTSSPLYTRLYEAGLINQNFYCFCESHPNCAFLGLGGESPNPDAVRDAVLEEAVRIERQGIADALWERLKRASYGTRVKSLNSFEATCIELAQGHFGGYDYFRFPEIYEGISKKDAESAAGAFLSAEHSALSVVWPKEAIL